MLNNTTSVFGGTERVIYNLKRELEKRGHTVLFAGEKQASWCSFVSQWFSLGWYLRTKALIRKFKPDIVHIHGCSSIISPSPIVAAIQMRVPVAMKLCDYYYVWGKNYKIGRKGNKNMLYQWVRFLKIALHRKILKSYPIRFSAPSQTLADAIENSMHVKVEVIYNGINLPKEHTIYRKIILFVGRLSPEKGLQTVLNTLDHLKDYQVLILGKGPMQEELEAKYKNVRFLGFQKPEEYYQHASILVMPSLWEEAFGVSIGEAMSYGLCVIGSDTGAIPELVKGQERGLIFKAADEADFQSKLLYLLQNPSEIKRMGTHGRKFAKRNFAWGKIVTQYERFYEKTIREFRQG